MLKFLSKILTTVLLFVTLSSFSQNNSVLVSNTMYKKWLQVGQTCYGCTSFYIMVVNQTEPSSDGLYYYNVYFWSNSFYNNGYVASTYLKNINVYGVDVNSTETPILKINYALVPPKSNYFDGTFHLAYVYSTSARQIVKITWSEIGIW